MNEDKTYYKLIEHVEKYQADTHNAGKLLRGVNSGD